MIDISCTTHPAKLEFVNDADKNIILHPVDSCTAIKLLQSNVNTAEKFETIRGPTFRSMCSAECQTALVKQKRESSAASTTKFCKWCGKEFRPKLARDVYCYDAHYQTCEV